MFSQQRPADTEMDSLGGLWNLQNDERLEADGVDPALSKGDGYMVLQKCIFSFVLHSSGTSETMMQNSGKSNYPSCSAADTVGDSCGLQTVKRKTKASSSNVKMKSIQSWQGSLKANLGRTSGPAGSGAAHSSDPGSTHSPPPASEPKEYLKVPCPQSAPASLQPTQQSCH